MATLPKPDSPQQSDLLQAVRARTPARILGGPAGPAYPTATQLVLRQDHAAAHDAVRAELDLVRDFTRPFVGRGGFSEATPCAASRPEPPLRPALGRFWSDAARPGVVQGCPAGVALQVAIGDGLPGAVGVAKVPPLL